MDVRPDVLHQVVMNNDLLSKPVEFAIGIHASGLHRVEAFNGGDEPQAVQQRPGAACLEVQVLKPHSNVKAGALRADRLNDRVTPNRELDVFLAAAISRWDRKSSKIPLDLEGVDQLDFFERSLCVVISPVILLGKPQNSVLIAYGAEIK